MNPFLIVFRDDNPSRVTGRLQIRRKGVTVGRAKLFSIVRRGIGPRPRVRARARYGYVSEIRYVRRRLPSVTSATPLLSASVELPRFPSPKKSGRSTDSGVFSLENAFLG